MKNINLLDTITDAREAKEHGIDCHILWAYDHTQEAKLERLDIEDLGFSDGYDTIEENLNRFGITELTISTTSTALMDNLTALKNMGFTPCPHHHSRTKILDWVGWRLSDWYGRCSQLCKSKTAGQSTKNS